MGLFNLIPGAKKAKQKIEQQISVQVGKPVTLPTPSNTAVVKAAAAGAIKISATAISIVPGLGKVAEPMRKVANELSPYAIALKNAAKQVDDIADGGLSDAARKAAAAVSASITAEAVSKGVSPAALASAAAQAALAAQKAAAPAPAPAPAPVKKEILSTNSMPDTTAATMWNVIRRTVHPPVLGSNGIDRVYRVRDYIGEQFHAAANVADRILSANDDQSRGIIGNTQALANAGDKMAMRGAVLFSMVGTGRTKAGIGAGRLSYTPDTARMASIAAVNAASLVPIPKDALPKVPTVIVSDVRQPDNSDGKQSWWERLKDWIGLS